MSIPGFCLKCGSLTAYEKKRDSIALQLLRVIGYQSLCCENRGFLYSHFSPMQILWNLVHLLLAAGTGFILWGSFFR